MKWMFLVVKKYCILITFKGEHATLVEIMRNRKGMIGVIMLMKLFYCLKVYLIFYQTNKENTKN